ncbi:di-trans,poly-cis-decaprenylcistransferase [Candidatus Saccharibacteria bacterium]|nr:di-trans,poly-cis-decaprenylcistransferase [Candidatus Saccharibacteria bacterium]
MIDSDKPPQHIGYILDGNRRWAKKHGLPTYEGHLAGYNALKDVIEATANAGVKYISFYTFSTQNWARAEGEVRGIMRLIRRLYKTDIKQLTKEGFRLVIMGAEDNIPDDIQEMGRLAEQQSRDGTRATLVMCFNYGGQEEIVRATRRLVVQGIQADKINLESVSAAMDHPEIPACDLIVRTSGEQRLSDFMLWRSAYSELMFLDKYWPEMTKDDVTDILKEYSRRIRRFGG